MLCEWIMLFEFLMWMWIWIQIFEWMIINKIVQLILTKDQPKHPNQVNQAKSLWKHWKSIGKSIGKVLCYGKA